MQAQNLVQQLLTFARGGAPIRQPTDIGRLVQEWFAEWPKRPGIDYRMGVSGDVWQADVDRHQIRRLLSNLMRNAEQAVGREGIVSVRLARPAQVGLSAAGTRAAAGGAARATGFSSKWWTTAKASRRNIWSMFSSRTTRPVRRPMPAASA